VDFPHAFQDSFLIENLVHLECSGLPRSYLTIVIIYFISHLHVLSAPYYRAVLACYLHDILYHISHLLLLDNASSIAYFAWGRVIIHMII
jgi:hypothetical protein